MFSNELVCNILDYIQRNLYEEIKIDDIVRVMYFNRTYIMKKFKREIGYSIVNYINIMKIYNSLKYLKYDKNILEVALKNGFNSQEYYSEIFKSVIGVPPITYKKYITFTNKLSNNNIHTINKNIINIESLITYVQKYMNNRKPQVITKKLSLFS